MFLTKIKEKIMFLTMAHKQEKKKRWQPHVVQLLHRVHQKKVDDSDFTSNKTKVINQKKKSNKPQKMENNELVEER